MLGAVALTLGLSNNVPAAHPDFVEPDVKVVFSATGEQSGDEFGWVAEDLGDINGDGASDFITSAPFHIIGGALAGKVYVYSGADGTLLASHTGNPPELLGYGASLAGDLDGDGVNDYVAGSLDRVVAWSGADHGMLWQQTGSTFRFGFDVDTAGDVNGDGLDEVIVGETGVNGNSGAVHLLSGLDGSFLWTRKGGETLDLLGSAVGRLDDVNGDGIPDVVAGARGGGHKNRGAAYALSGADGTLIQEMRPVGELPEGAAVGTFATFHAAGGGDVDGDGVSDVYVGDYNAFKEEEGAGAGRAYLFSGVDGNRIRVLNAESAGDGFGPGRVIPDVDGDGRADIFSAAYTWGPNSEGKAYVISGRGGVLRTMTGTQPFASLGVDALALDDANLDGRTDFVLTGSGVIHVIAGN